MAKDTTKSSSGDDKPAASKTDESTSDVLDNQVPDPGVTDESTGDAAITNAQS